MKILVIQEKHGDRYFDASTKNKLDEACRFILKERLEDTYYYHEEEPEELNYAMVPDDFKEEAKIKIEIRNQEIKEIRQNNEFRSKVNHAIDKDISLCYNLLLERSDYEYEQVHLEELENPGKS